MLTTTAPVRLLHDGDREAVLRLLARTPVASAPVAERVEGYGVSAWRSGGHLLGYEPRRGDLAGLCWLGAGAILLGAGPAAVEAFGEVLAQRPRGVSSLVGSAEATLDLWRRLEPVWGRARQLRAVQPLLVTDRAPAVAPDERVRPVRRRELSTLYPASVAMYTEEIGVPPAPEEYRDRVADLIRRRRAYARIERGEVIFKAEVAVVSRQTAQLQGVWVHPDYRGRGLAAGGLSAVVGDALRRLAPTVSLYVNDFNTPARRLYERCGFGQVDTFATVLF